MLERLLVSFFSLSRCAHSIATVRLCALGFLLSSTSVVQAAELRVLANAKGSASAVSLSMARAIFGMRMRDWPDGTPIRVFVLPSDNELHKMFCKKVLRVFPHKLQGQWDRVVYSGVGQAPEVVRSIDELLSKVADTPGAVGYAMQGEGPNNVRHIQIR